MKRYILLFLLLFSCWSLYSIEDNTNDVSSETFSEQTDSLDEYFVNKDWFLFKKDKPGYKYRVGIGNELSYVYYRRSFGLAYDLFANVRLYRGLTFQGGLKFMMFKYALTHFYPLTVNFFDNMVQGATGGARISIRYHFDLLEHFGLLVGIGISASLAYYSCFDYFHNYGINDKGAIKTCTGLELNPEIVIGATIPFGRYRIDVNCYKWFPVIPIHYNYADDIWMTAEDYNLKGYSPQRLVCWGSMGISVSFIYMIK